MAEAAARDAGQIFLEVSDRNGAARALYAAAGFEAVGRRRQYYTDGADALVLSRRPGGA
jgi:ribosomal-protein-alanine N-acetyltransferase